MNGALRQQLGRVAVVTLDRAERHNSLVPELIEAVGARFDEALESGAGAIVLAANGRTFSTGGDIRAIREAPERAAYAEHLVGGLNRLMLQMMDLPVPIVASVHGMVTGGSLGLLLASDIVVVEEQVTFRPWYATVGFAPDGGWTALMPAVIGPTRTRALLLSDEHFGAPEAVAWGLAHQMVPTGKAGAEALAIARRLSGLQPGSLSAVKRLATDRDAIAARLDAERAEFVATVVGDEATAGMDRFLAGEAS